MLRHKRTYSVYLMNRCHVFLRLLVVFFYSPILFPFSNPSARKVIFLVQNNSIGLFTDCITLRNTEGNEVLSILFSFYVVIISQQGEILLVNEEKSVKYLKACATYIPKREKNRYDS